MNDARSQDRGLDLPALIRFEQSGGTSPPVTAENRGQVIHALQEVVLDFRKRDHYLVQTKTGFRFRHTMVRRWWALQRGL
jgi:hypothetical protein